MNLDRVLQVESVTKAYGKGANKTEALKGISFDVLEGEFLGIMGASGSGKTTLLNCIATIIKPSSGRVLLKNNDVSSFKGVQLAGYRDQEIGLTRGVTATPSPCHPREEFYLKTMTFLLSKEEVANNSVPLADLSEACPFKKRIYIFNRSLGWNVTA
ncbi:MAG TPA: ATP-binding cassette domain-containing protein [Thermoclostridium sp.]|nr:ATP-binding cassette domain-containing protein [Thermoclostridium sp.]